jgi:hypothetical protein
MPCREYVQIISNRDSVKPDYRLSASSSQLKEAEMRRHLSQSISLTALALSLMTASAHADDFQTFKSALSSADGSWCIDVPEAQYQPGTRLLLSRCSGTPNQTFGFASRNNLTAGGLCLDGRAGTPGQPPGAGDPVVISECDGSDHQVWELHAFTADAAEVAIVSPAGLCVTVEGAAPAAGTPLVLAQCDQMPAQGWLAGNVARPQYASAPDNAAPEYYALGGHSYCWYDGGWHGPGWYWCGYNYNNGVGWGGPLGFNYWFHFGQPYINNPIVFVALPGYPGHPHGPGGGQGGFYIPGNKPGGQGGQGGVIIPGKKPDGQGGGQVGANGGQGGIIIPGKKNGAGQGGAGQINPKLGSTSPPTGTPTRADAVSATGGTHATAIPANSGKPTRGNAVGATGGTRTAVVPANSGKLTRGNAVGATGGTRTVAVSANGGKPARGNAVGATGGKHVTTHR